MPASLKISLTESEHNQLLKLSREPKVAGLNTQNTQISKQPIEENYHQTQSEK